MAPFFTGISGAITGQAGFGFGRRAKAKSLVTTIFTYTGSWTRNGFLSPTITTNTLAIPGDTTSVKINCQGQGINGLPQGAGGTAEATFAALSGKTLTAQIGGGGSGGQTFFFDPNPSPASNGFHYAGVFDGPVSQGNALVIGGAAGCPGGSQNAWGGNGGGPSGSDGLPGNRNDYQAPGSSVGRGSPGSSGGSGGDAFWSGGGTGASGSALQGGTGGGPDFFAAGAGGGGGYWGGGGSGGGTQANPQSGGSSGAGGGSGYVHSSGTLTTNTTGTATVGTSGQITITITELK